MVSRLTLSIVISATERGFRAFQKAETGLKGLLAASRAVQVALASIVAVPMVTAITKSVSAFRDFDLAMKQVQAITGATGQTMDEVSALARKLGRETVFTATEVGNAMFFMAQAGQTTDEIMKNVIQTLRIAQLGQLDLGLASDIVTDIMAGYQLQAEDMARVTDILAVTFASFNTSVEGLGAAFSFAASTASNLKVPIEEVATAIGFLSSAGIKGERAGTTLRRSFLALSGITARARNTMASYGITIFDAEGNFKGLTNALSEFSDLQKRLSQQEFVQVIGRIFGQRGADFQVLINAFDAAGGEWDQFLEKLGGPETVGAAERMTDVIDRSLDAGIKRIQAFLTDIGIDIGEFFASTFGPIEDFLRTNETDLRTLVQLTIEFLDAFRPALPLIAAIVVGIVKLLTVTMAIMTLLSAFNSALFEAGGLIILLLDPMESIVEKSERIASTWDRIVDRFRQAGRNIGGGIRGIGESIAGVFSGEPPFQHGGRVKNTGMFRLERGEEILPASRRTSVGGVIDRPVMNNTFNIVVNRMEPMEFEQMVLGGLNRVERR